MKTKFFNILFVELILRISAFNSENNIVSYFNFPENISKCGHQDLFVCKSENITLGKTDVCNGVADCLDGSDEECNECQTAFYCKQYSAAGNISYLHNKCLYGSALCDGTKDCENGEDEIQYCRTKCYSTEFQCNDMKMCIPYSFICDGDSHCKNGDDEEKCKGFCRNGAKWCNHSQKCIPKWKICNGIQDCFDGSDENECNCETCAGDNKSICLEEKKEFGTCILDRHICDGVSHCPNGIDERGCPGWCQKNFEKESSASFVNCNGTKIHKLYACDGYYPECKGQCDECHWTSFDCGNGHCIGRAHVCNGHLDCNDGSDEWNCNTDTENYVLCKTPHGYPKKYILKKFLCDGVIDCPLHDDERNCLMCKGDDTFYCKTDKKCIKSRQRCNGNIDCTDLSDEINCNCDACSIHPEPLYFCSSENRCINRKSLCYFSSTTCKESAIDEAYCAALGRKIA